MAFKKPTTQATVAESPDRLFRDLPRRKHASLFDHQGQMLRTYFRKALSATDVALQLPTGSGKTLVGLLLAEWRRRKNHERIVYLCPTRQLVNQVVEEASSKYGLTVEAFTGTARNYSPDAKAAYENADRVAVTTYSSLFNTNPFFANPEVVIVDDAHASENYIASHWTFRVTKSEPSEQVLFRAIAGVLKAVLSEADFHRLIGDRNSIENLTWVDKLPTTRLADIAAELRATIEENVGDLGQRFAWSMIADHLCACQLYVSAGEIVVRPLIPPTWAHAPFAGATQRIFMSATLGAGGDLERLTGRRDILRLPIPDGWDRQGIGRRFFVFPEKSLDADGVLELRRRMMEAGRRSLVLTPSNASAEEIVKEVGSGLGYTVFSGSDLEDRKSEFVTSDPAVAVVANRYDGIDLPDDDCRLLFVEGLPQATNLQERFLMARMGANVLFNERIQTRVLQAVGRCTRGLNDYSAVVVTGEHLPAYLTNRKRRSFLHPELQAELEFGIDQSTGVEADSILENLDIFLEHDAAWEEANQSIIDTREKATQSEFPAMADLAAAVPHEIAWQRALWGGDHGKAYDSAREVLGKLNDPELRGYRALWHYLAGSAADLGAASGDSRLKGRSTPQFGLAKEAAFGIPWLVSLSRVAGLPQTTDEKENATLMLQIERLEEYLSKLGTLHNRAFSAREKEIREGLASGKSFERAQVLLGAHLGFEPGKREDDASPDPWWRIGDVVLVFEDHANAGRDAVVDATKARQAASHPDWIRAHMPGTAQASIQSVLVTPATRAKQGAVPHLGRVCHWDLEGFRSWAYAALDVVRTLRRTFLEAGDLAWRAEAARLLSEAKVDAGGLARWLSGRSAAKHLQSVP